MERKVQVSSKEVENGSRNWDSGIIFFFLSENRQRMQGKKKKDGKMKVVGVNSSPIKADSITLYR